jgi:hypothetical protein
MPVMGEDRTAPERRLTVSDAAQELGISAEAVRSRIKRGTLDSTKEGRTVYVLLPGRPDSDQTTTGHDRTNDQAPPEHDQTGTRADVQGELVDSLLDQVTYMREQLAEEREARRRADTIIAQLSQANAALARRVPEIEAPAPPEATGAPETRLGDSGEPYSTHAPPKPESPLYGTSSEAQEAEDSLQRRERSWWRRFFGME